MTKFKGKQKLASLLYLLTATTESKVKNPKTDQSNKAEARKKGQPDVLLKNNYVIISNKTVGEEIFLDLKDKPQINTILLHNCNINTYLTRPGYHYVLYDSDFSNESDRTRSKFIAIQNLDRENGERVILFYNCSLDDSIKEVYAIFNENTSKYQFNKVAKVIFKNVSFEEDEAIQETFEELKRIHKLSRFSDLEIKNPMFNDNQELFKRQLQSFVANTAVNLLQERSAIISGSGFGGVSGGISSSSNMQSSGNEGALGSLKYSKTELEKNMKDISGIISDPAYVQSILDSYDYIKRNSNSSDHQAKAKVFYYMTRMELLRQYPKNLKKSDFRNFRSTDYVKQIVRRLFQKEFPAGLTDFLQRLEDAVIFLVQAQDTSKLENMLLVGPAGIGKTSLSRIIAMIFALSIASKSDISDELLDSALVDDESLETVYNKLLELSKYHIIDIKGSSISDINIITGTATTYTGAKAGIIAEMLAGKKLPLLIFVDEIDKVANYHGSSSKKGMDAIYTALLNYLDKHGGRDTWLEGTLMMNGIWFVMTANTVDGINNTFLNRLNVVNLESPTAEEKKKILLRYLLNTLKRNSFVKNVNNYTTERDSASGEIIRYVIGGKDNKIKLVLEDKVLTGIVAATQETDGLRAPLRYIDTLWTKLYLQIIENEKNRKAQEYFIDSSNIQQYINIENMDTEVIKGKNIIRCIYEASDGNHKFGNIAVMLVKNRSGEVISIIGDDQNHGMLFSGLGKLINGLLSNLNMLVDSQYYAKFGLGIIKMETLNLILTMPNDAVKSFYTTDTIATVMVIMISVIRKIPLKENVIIVGQLAPSGQFVKGVGGSDDKKDRIKYKNVIAAVTNNPSSCNLLILPASAKKDQEIQGYLKKIPKRIKVVYAANLGEILDQALDASQIS